MGIWQIVLLIIFTAFISYVLTPLTILLARRLNLLDDPNVRKHPANTHAGVIPRGGGLPIYLAIAASILLFLPSSKIVTGILIGGALVIVMGLLDDYYDLSPYLRLAMNIAIGVLVTLFGLGVPYISNPLGGVIRLDTIRWDITLYGAHYSFLVLANAFSVIWIVAIMNFINWSKGVDGQLPGFVSIASLFLGILAFRFTGHDISTLAVAMFGFIVAGAFLGFLPWNFYPQKIMPGYGGGALAGFMLAVLSILAWNKIGTMILVLAVPIVDAIYVLLRRFVHAKSLFRGDDGHFHHRLLKIGWGRRRIAVFYWCVSLLFGVAATVFESQQKIIAIIVVVIMTAFFITFTGRIIKEE